MSSVITNKINPYVGVYKRDIELYNNGYYIEGFSKLSIIIENDVESNIICSICNKIH